MHVFRSKRFGPLEAWEAGFGPLGPPLMTVHLYLVDGILIDTGQRHMGREIVGALTGKTINRILLTHHHEDHSGNAGRLHRERGVPVLAHPLAAEKLKQANPVRPYQKYIWGRAEPVAVSPLPAVIETGRLRLRPVHTPGHSKDHTVFLEETRGWLFSGDLYLGDRIKYFRAD
ncbi:MAG: MBL fold metallo-hydrolase, partial [Desulfosudaceae bacterium]